MANPTPQVIRVKKPLILSGPVGLGILSPRPFGAAGDLTPQIPAYEVPPALMLHGPAPKPTTPLHDIYGSKLPNDYLYLDRFTLLLKGQVPEKEHPPHPPHPPHPHQEIPYVLYANIEPLIMQAALPTSPAHVGAPRSSLLVVNPDVAEAVPRIHPKPVWMSTVEPAGAYHPPLYYERLFDDDYLASLFPVPVLPLRGVVPTPAPVGAPRGFLAVVVTEDVAPLLVIEPIIIHITPIGVPEPPCPGPSPRVDEGCVFIGRGDEGCVVYARAEDAGSRVSRVDVCCN